MILLTPLAGRRLPLLLTATLSVWLVAACTGTTEPRPPTLLLVGVESGGTPRLLLIEDVTATAPPGSPRLQVVPGGARDLQAPAIGLEFENRDGGREAAWVLTREVTAGAGGAEVSAYLQRFGVHAIDPAAPASFAEDVAARLTLTEPGGGGVLDGLSLSSPATCPTALQVTRDGGLAAVLDDPSACGLSDHPELWLIDTAAGTARVLQGTNDLLPVGIYLDQRPEAQRLYFLIDAITNVHVYVDGLDGDPSGRHGQLTLQARGEDLLHLAGAGDALIALETRDVLSVDLRLPSPAPPQTEASTLQTGANRLVADPSGFASDVIVLGTTRTAVHEDLEDSAPSSTAFTAVAATIDPVVFFAYGVAQGRVLIIDLLTGGTSGEPLRVHAEQLAEITLPDGGVVAPAGLSVIGWIRAVPPPEP